MNLTDYIHEAEILRAVPRANENGYLQLNLSNTRQLHFWGSSRVPRTKTNLQIHNHSTGFESIVLKGTLINAKYDVVLTPDPTLPYRVWREEPRPRRCELVRFADLYANIKASQLQIVNEGSKYRMDFATFHETIISEPTVTLVLPLLNERNPITPFVLVKADETPDPYNRECLEIEEMWNIIQEFV